VALHLCGGEYVANIGLMQATYTLNWYPKSRCSASEGGMATLRGVFSRLRGGSDDCAGVGAGGLRATSSIGLAKGALATLPPTRTRGS